MLESPDPRSIPLVGGVWACDYDGIGLLCFDGIHRLQWRTSLLYWMDSCMQWIYIKRLVNHSHTGRWLNFEFGFEFEFEFESSSSW